MTKETDIAAPEADGMISVVLCTFNGARYLPEQLASILQQTRQPDEMVICDDGSSDETVMILEEFADCASFDVRLHQNPERLGPSANFNLGMGLARHEFIALSDQDDVWLPSRLKRQSAALSYQPSAGMCFSDAEIINGDSVPTGQRIWNRVGFRPDREMWSADRLLHELMRHTVVTGATLMVRSTVFDVARPVPATWLHDEWIAVVNAASGFDAMCLDEPLVSYRMHDDQHTGLRVATLDLDAVRSGRRPIAGEVERSSTLIELLGNIPSVGSSRLDVVKDRHAHLVERERAGHDNSLVRFVRVLGQLVRGRYHRYSNGWTSAAADVAGRTRQTGGSGSTNG